MTIKCVIIPEQKQRMKISIFSNVYSMIKVQNIQELNTSTINYPR